MNRWGGKKITKEQREEILRAYIRNPAEGSRLAMSHGLSQIYAYKLAHERGLLPVKKWPQDTPPKAADPIIDRSPFQKQMRLEKLRLELFELGYSVVPTEQWLASLQNVPFSHWREAAE